jgi:hypothetical protein
MFLLLSVKMPKRQPRQASDSRVCKQHPGRVASPLRQLPRSGVPSTNDVPEQTADHAVFRQRAAAAHQPLQEYLRPRLIQEASEPVLEEVLDRAGGRSGGSVPLQDAVTAVRSDAA